MKKGINSKLSRKLRITLYFMAVFVVGIGAIFTVRSYVKKDMQEIFLQSEKYSIKNNKLIKYGFFRNKTLVLSGFEKEIGRCYLDNQSEIENIKLLCLTGYVGAHSQNMVFINTQTFKTILFAQESGAVTKSIYSDVPKFGTKMLDDKIVLEVLNRNYDKNPIEDTIINYYMYSDNYFSLTKNLF